jgi:hypothetical protein
LAILALALRVLVPAFCHPQSMPSWPQSVDDPTGQMVMCTSHGLQLPADLAKPGPETPLSAPDHCPACALVKALAFAAFFALVLAWIFATSRPRVAWIRAASDLLPDHLRHGSSRSRAPPFPA